MVPVCSIIRYIATVNILLDKPSPGKKTHLQIADRLQMGAGSVRSIAGIFQFSSIRGMMLPVKSGRTRSSCQAGDAWGYPLSIGFAGRGHAIALRRVLRRNSWGAVNDWAAREDSEVARRMQPLNYDSVPLEWIWRGKDDGNRFLRGPATIRKAEDFCGQEKQRE